MVQSLPVTGDDRDGGGNGAVTGDDMVQAWN